MEVWSWPSLPIDRSKSRWEAEVVLSVWSAKYCETSYSRSGVNQMWILKNSKELLEHPKEFKRIIRTSSISKIAYSSGHMVLSHLGLAFVLMLRPFFPELVIVYGSFEFRTSLGTSILPFNHITSIKSLDFSTLYTTIPHQKLKSRLATIIGNSFIHKKWKSQIQISGFRSRRTLFCQGTLRFETQVHWIWHH